MLPIIATRVAAVPEVVSEGVTALLVNPGDESTLAQMLETLLDDAALRKRLGDAGRAHVARQFLAAIGVT